MQKYLYWFMNINSNVKEVGEGRTFHLLPYLRIEFKPMFLEWQRVLCLLKFIVSGVILQAAVK